MTLSRTDALTVAQAIDELLDRGHLTMMPVAQRLDTILRRNGLAIGKAEDIDLDPLNDEEILAAEFDKGFANGIDAYRRSIIEHLDDDLEGRWAVVTLEPEEAIADAVSLEDVKQLIDDAMEDLSDE